MKSYAQSAGFEPARAEPNGFLVHRLNHSATTAAMKLGILNIGAITDISFLTEMLYSFKVNLPDARVGKAQVILWTLDVGIDMMRDISPCQWQCLLAK